MKQAYAHGLVHNRVMHRFPLVVALLLFSLIASGDDLLGPAEYLKILEESKLRYNFVTEPAKDPVELMTCPRRDDTLRLVAKENGEKSLIAWEIKPEAKKLLDEGEVLYQSKKLAEAAEKFKAAIAADPQAATGYYVYGDTLLFGAKDPAAALEQYRKGLALDPSVPSGHLFASTALVHLGRPDEAREEIIKALVYHPGYDVVVKLAEQRPDRWNAKPITRHRFEPPAGFLGKKGDRGIDIYAGPEMAWLGYAMCKAAWKNEEKFRKQPSGTEGEWSLEEERACILNQIMGMYNTVEARLEEQKKAEGVKEPKFEEAEIVAALPPLERHLFDVAKARLLDGYILFEIIGQHCPLAMSLSPEQSLADLESYIRNYVIVAK